MKKLILILATTIFSLLGIHTASAHAQLTSSFPSKNQTLNALPNLVWLEFDGDLLSFGEKQVNRLTVTNSKKVRVDDGASFVGGARISTRLRANLPPGKYLISYRIVSEDGHPVTGSFSFVYKAK